jgi:hypothetical protein
MSVELKILIGAKAARVHRLATAEELAGIDRLSLETAELQAMIAEAIREERLQERPARLSAR